MIIDYIERYKNLFGVEPICTALTKSGVPIAPSTFYAARTRPASARALRDEELKPEIVRVDQENYGVYGIRKMHAQLAREQVLAGAAPVARCTTRRLMKALGLKGISRSKGPRTTVAGTGPHTRPDLVKRAFTANAPNQLWVADTAGTTAPAPPAASFETWLPPTLAASGTGSGSPPPGEEDDKSPVTGDCHAGI